jgi:hypothetical protein
MGHAPAGVGRPPKNRPPRTGPRRPVGAGIVPNLTPRLSRRPPSGTASRGGPAPAAMAGRPAAPGLAGIVHRKPGRVRRQPLVRQAAPRRAGPRPAGPAPAPSRPGARPPKRSAGGAAARRASLRIRNLILTTGGPKSAGPLVARSPDPRPSSRQRIRGSPARWAGAAGLAAGPRHRKRPQNGPRWPRPTASGRRERRGRAAGPGGAAAAGSS